jgi:hypothetical protein
MDNGDLGKSRGAPNDSRRCRIGLCDTCCADALSTVGMRHYWPPWDRHFSAASINDAPPTHW